MPRTSTRGPNDLLLDDVGRCRCYWLDDDRDDDCDGDGMTTKARSWKDGCHCLEGGTMSGYPEDLHKQVFGRKKMPFFVLCSFVHCYLTLSMCLFGTVNHRGWIYCSISTCCIVQYEQQNSKTNQKGVSCALSTFLSRGRDFINPTRNRE